MRQYRQGDVFIQEVKNLPEKLEKVERDNGRVVLAYGEVTGHAHAISDKEAVLMSFGAERFLRTEKPVMLYHEEHDPIELPAGNFRVTIQREYSPEEVRNVLD